VLDVVAPAAHGRPTTYVRAAGPAHRLAERIGCFRCPTPHSSDCSFDVTTLARLDLGHNEILELPPGIGKLVRLEELWLNNNPLATLPADIQSCIMLKSLYLAVRSVLGSSGHVR